MERIVVCVRDLQSRFSEEHVYHLAVRGAALPELNATVAIANLTLPAGGSVLLPVELTRTGYDGPVRLELEGLPAGVVVAGADVPAGANQALLSLTAPAEHPRHALVRIVAMAADPQVKLARYALGPAPTGAERYQPQLRYDLGLAITPPAPIELAWEDTPAPAPLFAGMSLPLAYRLKRAEGVAGDVRVRLVTNQPTPRKKIKENNQDKEVDDPDRTLRLAEGMPVLMPDAPAAPLALLLPGDLAERRWDYALVAELLSADGKNVVASSATPVRGVTCAAPVALELTSTPQAEGKAGRGEPGQFTGKIRRHEKFQQPVTIALAGLPDDVKGAPRVTLAPDQTEFTLPLTFEFGSKVGEYKGLKLGVFLTDVPTPAASAEVELKLTPGEKPE
jgi:hypothetical protein